MPVQDFDLNSCNTIRATYSAYSYGVSWLQLPDKKTFFHFYYKTLVVFYYMKGLIHKWNHWNPMGSVSIK